MIEQGPVYMSTRGATTYHNIYLTLRGSYAVGSGHHSRRAADKGLNRLSGIEYRPLYRIVVRPKQLKTRHAHV